MNIQITDIADLKTSSNGFGSRLILADQIIEQFTPLFSDEIERSRQQLSNNKADISKLRKDVTKYKQNLKTVNEAVKKETIKQQMLTEMNYLNTYGVLYGQNKQVVRDILLQIDSQSIGNLGEDLKVLKRLVKSNIRKIMR